MKAARLIILAATGVAVAACGSGTKPTTNGSTLTFTAPTTTTIGDPQTGATVRCSNHGIAAGAKVPPPGHGVSGSADGTSSSATLTLTRKSDGSLDVSCLP